MRSITPKPQPIDSALIGFLKSARRLAEWVTQSIAGSPVARRLKFSRTPGTSTHCVPAPPLRGSLHQSATFLVDSPMQDNTSFQNALANDSKYEMTVSGVTFISGGLMRSARTIATGCKMLFEI